MKIKILNLEPGELLPEETYDEFLRTKSYDTPYLVTNSTTICYTDSLAPCIGLAICAKDSGGTMHRIICHCPYAPPVHYMQLEGRIEKYLKSINGLIELNVKLATFDTFFEINLDDYSIERDLTIVNRINKLFEFWKVNHDEFEIEVIQSSKIGILPDGKFLIEPLDEKQKEIEERIQYSENNTRFVDNTITLSLIERRLTEYNNCIIDSDVAIKKGFRL